MASNEHRAGYLQTFFRTPEKIIYLDSDIIVNLDIKELWQIELGDKIMAAVPEISSWKKIEEIKQAFNMCNDGIVKCEDYFNSGVLPVNLNLLRKEENTIMDGLRFRMRNNPRYWGYFDQDVLNYCFSTRILKLPVKFNRFSLAARLEKESSGKKIYHYAGASIGHGLGANMDDSFNRLWMDYFIKSPWFDSSTIGRLYEKARTDSQEAMINLSAAMSGKTRAFILFEKDLEALVKIFSVKNDEDILLVEVGSPVKKIIDVMNALHNEKFFFIMLPDFQFLTAAGFVEGKDFLNVRNFLPETQDIITYSYPLIKAM